MHKCNLSWVDRALASCILFEMESPSFLYPVQGPYTSAVSLQLLNLSRRHSAPLSATPTLTRAQYKWLS